MAKHKQEPEDDDEDDSNPFEYNDGYGDADGFDFEELQEWADDASQEELASVVVALMQRVHEKGAQEVAHIASVMECGHPIFIVSGTHEMAAAVQGVHEGAQTKPLEPKRDGSTKEIFTHPDRDDFKKKMLSFRKRVHKTYKLDKHDQGAMEFVANNLLATARHCARELTEGGYTPKETTTIGACAAAFVLYGCQLHLEHQTGIKKGKKG